MFEVPLHKVIQLLNFEMAIQLIAPCLSIILRLILKIIVQYVKVFTVYKLKQDMSLPMLTMKLTKRGRVVQWIQHKVVNKYYKLSVTLQL